MNCAWNADFLSIDYLGMRVHANCECKMIPFLNISRRSDRAEKVIKNNIVFVSRYFLIFFLVGRTVIRSSYFMGVMGLVVWVICEFLHFYSELQICWGFLINLISLFHDHLNIVSVSCYFIIIFFLCFFWWGE